MKTFSEEGLFVFKLPRVTSHIITHCYDVLGSILSIYCLPLSDNWRVSSVDRYRYNYYCCQMLQLRFVAVPSSPDSLLVFSSV